MTRVIEYTYQFDTSYSSSLETVYYDANSSSIYALFVNGQYWYRFDIQDTDAVNALIDSGGRIQYKSLYRLTHKPAEENYPHGEALFVSSVANASSSEYFVDFVLDANGVGYNTRVVASGITEAANRVSNDLRAVGITSAEITSIIKLTEE